MQQHIIVGSLSITMSTMKIIQYQQWYYAIQVVQIFASRDYANTSLSVIPKICKKS